MRSNFSGGRLFAWKCFPWLPSHRQLLLCFCFPSDYESLRKEDVFENNRLVRSQVAELLIPVEVTLCSSCGEQTKKKKHSRGDVFTEALLGYASVSTFLNSAAVLGRRRRWQNSLRPLDLIYFANPCVTRAVAARIPPPLFSPLPFYPLPPGGSQSLLWLPPPSRDDAGRRQQHNLSCSGGRPRLCPFILNEAGLSSATRSCRRQLARSRSSCSWRQRNLRNTRTRESGVGSV